MRKKVQSWRLSEYCFDFSCNNATISHAVNAQATAENCGDSWVGSSVHGAPRWCGAARRSGGSGGGSAAPAAAWAALIKFMATSPLKQY